MLRLILLVLFSAAVLQADRILLSPLWRQLDALKRPVVEGRVVSIEPLLQYEFSVEGRTYRGHQRRYSQFGSATAPQIPHQPGNLVQVHYPAANPLDSVLEVGWNGSDLLLLMFMLPWNTLAMLGWLRIPGVPGFRIWQGGPDLNTRLFRALNTALTLTSWSMLAAAIFTLLAVGIHPLWLIPTGNIIVVLMFCSVATLSSFRQPLREAVVLHDKEFTIYIQGQARRLSYELVKGLFAESDGRIVLDYGSDKILISRSADPQKWLPVLRAKLLRAK